MTDATSMTSQRRSLTTKRCGLGPKTSKPCMRKRSRGPRAGIRPPKLSFPVREAQQHAFEQELWMFCQPSVRTTAVQRVFCERVEAFVPALFVFVRIPGVPAHNTLAERSVRPLVITRKMSGGTRSPKGSRTRMGLASLFGTWTAQHLNPFHQCLSLLTSTCSLSYV